MQPFGPPDLWRFDGWGECDKGGISFYKDWRAATPWGETRPDHGREEVRRFIRDNALYRFETYGIDGLRFVMTLHMRNVSGNESDPAHNLEDGRSLVRRVNDEIAGRYPDRITIAEYLRRLDAITAPTGDGGAGFGAQRAADFLRPVRAILTEIDDAHPGVTVALDFRGAAAHEVTVALPAGGRWRPRLNTDWDGIPALVLAQADAGRGMLSPEQEDRVAETAMGMVRGLAPVIDEELRLARAAEPGGEAETGAPGSILSNGLLDGEGHAVITVGGGGRLDDVAAEMLAQALAGEGAVVASFASETLSGGSLGEIARAEGHTVLVGFLDGSQDRAVRLQVRRLKRTVPNKRVGVVLWGRAAELETRVLEAGADFVAHDLETSLAAAFEAGAPKPLAVLKRHRTA